MRFRFGVVMVILFGAGLAEVALPAGSAAFHANASDLSTVTTVTNDFSADKSGFLLGNSVRLTADTSGTGGATDVAYSWSIQCADMAEPIVETGNPIDFTATVPGRYAVTLTVESSGTESSLTKDDCFYAAPLTNYVTNAKVDTARFPYATAATAATNIADAVDAAIDGSVVLLPTGKVEFASAILLTNGVAICGAGMTNTTLYATTAFAPAVTLNDADAKLCDLTLAHARIKNSFKDLPIAVLINANGGSLIRCRVTDATYNSQYSAHGAIWMNSSAGLISHCIVDNNAINGGNCGGGAIDVGSGLVENTLVFNNTSGNFQFSEKVSGGGGIRLNGGKAVNCTIVGNTISGSTGGGVCKSADAILENCIIYGNFAPDDTSTPSVTGAPNLGGSTENVFHCLVGQDVGTNPILGAPEFADAANNDYTLVSSSPCRDVAAESRYLELLDLDSIVGEVDLAGFTRLSGKAIDAGAYEYDASQVSCAFSIDADWAFVPATFTLTPTVEGFSDSEAATLTWTFTPVHGGPAVVSEQTGTNALVQVLSSNEQYRVSLAVSGGGQSSSFTRAETIYAAPRTNYVATAGTANPVFPYSTPETATTSIEEAFGIAVDGSVILLSTGTFEFASALSFQKNITVRGAGMTNTTLYATTAFAPAVTLNDADAKLCDLTLAHTRLKNSFKDQPIAVLIDKFGGSLIRCRVTDATYNSQSSARGAIWMNSSAGLISHCIVDNNAINGNSCGGGAIDVGSGLVENTLVFNNTSGNYQFSEKVSGGGGIRLNGGKAVNCTIVGNTISGSTGGGVCKSADAILENCIIYGNFAPDDTSTPSVTGAPNLGGSTENVFHCLVGQDVGTNPILGAPEFADAANNDYTLVSSSPCRDVAAESRYLELLDLDSIVGEVDLAGFTRLSGKAIDAGAYEYDASQVSCAFSIDAEMAFVPATFTLTPIVEGFSDPEAATLSWTFTPVHGGTATVVEQTGTNALVQVLSSNEQYRVSLAVSGGGQSSSFTRAETIYAAARTNYVVAAAKANPVFPYSTPETATASVKDAIAAAVDGATVFLGVLTNDLTATISINDAITVIGSGMESTLVRAKSGIKIAPLFELNNADAGIYRMTMADANSSSWSARGGAVTIWANGGTVADCRVTGVKSSCGYGLNGALQVRSEKALITRCIIDGNSANGGMPGSTPCGGLSLIKGLAVNCLITNNVGGMTDYKGSGLHVGSGGHAVNCTILGNQQLLANGTGVYVTKGGSLQNCIVEGNLTSEGLETNVIGEAYCSYCLSPTFTSTANGNIIGRPVFEKKRPLILTRDSPGQGKGSTIGYEELLIGGLDLLDHPRVRRVRSNGQGRLDIGCTESAHQSGCVFFVR